METNFNKIHQIADELKYAQNELLKKIAQNIDDLPESKRDIAKQMMHEAKLGTLNNQKLAEMSKNLLEDAD